jgi:urease accessory protein
MRRKTRSTLLLTLLGVIFTPFAQAHGVTTATMGLLSGLVHPLTGVDHVLAVSGGAHPRAMVAAFLGMLGLGALAGLAGIPLALVEPAIAVSVIALGALIALRVGATPVTGPVVAGGFALFHGYAHTACLPMTASALGYALGLVLMTALLLMSGVALGCRLDRFDAADRRLNQRGTYPGVCVKLL